MFIINSQNIHTCDMDWSTWTVPWLPWLPWLLIFLDAFDPILNYFNQEKGRRRIQTEGRR